MKPISHPSSHKTKMIIAIIQRKPSILTSFDLLVANSVPPEPSLPEVRYNSHYANDDKIDTNQII